VPTTPDRDHGFQARQQPTALVKNVEVFTDNDAYKAAQKRLELYQFVGLAASHETKHSRLLLDIGNTVRTAHAAAFVIHAGSVPLVPSGSSQNSNSPSADGTRRLTRVTWP
jgi:hypothetical protein